MIIIHKRLLIIPSKIYINLRYIKTKNNVVKVPHLNSPTIKFMAGILGLSLKKSTDILRANKELCNISQKDIINSVETLQSMNYNLNEISEKPKILNINAMTLENRYAVLKECGCNEIPLSTLSKYITVMNKDVTKLKTHRIIPLEINVQEKLEKYFANEYEIKVEETLTDTTQLKTIREFVLNVYLKKKLNMKDGDLKKQWIVYSRIRHKSYKSITRMIDLLLNELHLAPERIIKNGYAIYGDPDNVLKMLDKIKKIGNDDFREILHRRPKILMSNCESILQTIEHIRSFNIPETAITKCLEILTLGSDTVLERLEDIKNVEEFQVLSSNPRILRLIHYQNKARIRLEYLNQMKVRCASLHILSCGSNAFVKFARDGSDRTKGRDVVIFLGNLFQKSAVDIRKFISRHPNWCHIPVVQVKQCMDALIEKKFKNHDIFPNIYILLYPIVRIEEKLEILRRPETLKEFGLPIDYYKVSNKLLLTLCLYLIEYEYHFMGDGVWTEHHTQQVENFTNLLPDFPAKLQKDYKYGIKAPLQEIKPKNVANTL